MVELLQWLSCCSFLVATVVEWVWQVFSAELMAEAAAKIEQVLAWSPVRSLGLGLGLGRCWRGRCKIIRVRVRVGRCWRGRLQDLRLHGAAYCCKHRWHYKASEW